MHQLNVRLPTDLHRLFSRARGTRKGRGFGPTYGDLVASVLKGFLPKPTDSFPQRKSSPDRVALAVLLPVRLIQRLDEASVARRAIGAPFDSKQAVLEEAIARYLYHHGNEIGLDQSQVEAATGYGPANPPPSQTPTENQQSQPSGLAFRVSIDPGDATPEMIADYLTALDNLFHASGGVRLTFKREGSKLFAMAEAPA